MSIYSNVKYRLQPQVDSHEIRTTAKNEQDKIQAIDSILQRIDQEIPDSDSEKVTKFKKMWNNMKAKWEKLKLNQDLLGKEIETTGLGSNKGDERLISYMQNNPNALLTGPNQVPTGPNLG